MALRILIFTLVSIIGLNANAQSDKRFIALIYNPKVSFFNSDLEVYKDNRHPLIKNDIGCKIYLSKREKIKFVTGLIYTNKGWQDEYSDLTVKRNYSFISVPLILDFRLLKSEKLSLHLPIGLIPEILIDYDKRTDNGEQEYDIESRYTGNLDNTSFHIGLRLNYLLKENVGLTFEPNLNYQLVMNDHRRLYDYGIEIGLSYGF